VIVVSTDLEKREKHEVSANTAEQMTYAGPAYSPDVDIYASTDAAVFAVDLPGVGKGDVTIQVDETDSLVIRGKNSHKEPENVVLRQYNTGNYYRAFQISEDYDKEKINAKLENGLLVVTVPKREEAKPRKIEIKA
jgi:HSP20 family protein